MERGQRVEVVANCEDPVQGLRYIAGQRGTFKQMLDGLALIEFDGYEAERASAATFRQQHGEAPNIVPWAGLVPPASLREIRYWCSSRR